MDAGRSGHNRSPGVSLFPSDASRSRNHVPIVRGFGALPAGVAKSPAQPADPYPRFWRPACYDSAGPHGPHTSSQEREMIFVETELKGAFVIELERRGDKRGFFARAFCQKEFEAHGLKPIIAQANLASNRLKGTIRGMHFQYPPAAE